MGAWFCRDLYRWYDVNKRDLPWRHTQNPYLIWLSEVILQQTQVAQGLSYYTRFSESFPDIHSLANASEDDVLRLWQGLGYYSRARNLHAAAKQIAGRKDGLFPSSYREIRELKGVGSYTAAAIASFAFNLPHAVVDGNVFRFLSRLFGVETPVDSLAGKKEITSLADSLLDRSDPARFNQAIMEFGSQFCRPRNPDCGACPFGGRCEALRKNLVGALPVKSKSIKVKARYFNYLVLRDKKRNLLVRKREGDDIWKGLFEFPLIESETLLEVPALISKSGLSGRASLKLLYSSRQYKHVLSHQHLYARFHVFDCAFKLRGELMAKGAYGNYAFPRLIGKFIEDCKSEDLSYF